MAESSGLLYRPNTKLLFYLHGSKKLALLLMKKVLLTRFLFLTLQRQQVQACAARVDR